MSLNIKPVQKIRLKKLPDKKQYCQIHQQTWQRKKYSNHKQDIFLATKEYLH